MKVSQLIEYNMKNIFLEKSYTKCSMETIPSPFFRKIKIEHISGYILFLFVKLRTIRSDWN